MRNLVILIAALLCLAESAYAQRYLPVLVDGRTWITRSVFSYQRDVIALGNEERYTVDGDSVVDGVSYVKVRYEMVGEPMEYMGRVPVRRDMIWCEEDGKTYCNFYSTVPVYLSKMSDMDLEVGEWYVEGIRYMNIRGVTRKVLYGEYKTVPEDDYRRWRFLMIEGLGAVGGYAMESTPGTSPLPDKIVYEMKFTQEVWDGDTKIYDRDEFIAQLKEELSSDINVIEVNEPEGDGKLYNLMGLPVAHPRKGNIYIRNGKKILWND